NPGISSRIEQLCIRENGIFLGMIPYDKNITAAQIAGKSIIEYGDSPASVKIRQIWETICQKIL
ncbi:MAG: (4Fe-4S)-binding protein, partial [Spirochaetota bacterium]